MTKTITIMKDQKPTREQLAEVETSKTYPIEFDDDCPELSPTLMKAFECVKTQKNRTKKA